VSMSARRRETTSQRVHRVRASGQYEPYRDQLNALIMHDGLTDLEISLQLGVSLGKVRLMVRALELGGPHRLRGRSVREAGVRDRPLLRASTHALIYMAQRNEELRLVEAIHRYRDTASVHSS
jgi:hypothetical protein